jgi:hypothetical protein
MKMRVEVRPNPHGELHLPNLTVYAYANPHGTSEPPKTFRVPRTELSKIGIDSTYMIVYKGYEFPAHEFGHLLGLVHPGHMVYETVWMHFANARETYEYAGDDYLDRPVGGLHDVMSRGQPVEPNDRSTFLMRPFYYNRWLAALEESGGVPGCDRWHIDDKH